MNALVAKAFPRRWPADVIAVERKLRNLRAKWADVRVGGGSILRSHTVARFQAAFGAGPAAEIYRCARLGVAHFGDRANPDSRASSRVARFSPTLIERCQIDSGVAEGARRRFASMLFP